MICCYLRRLDAECGIFIQSDHDGVSGTGGIGLCEPSSRKGGLISNGVEIRVADKQTTRVGLQNKSFRRQMFNRRCQDELDSGVRLQKLRAGDLSSPRTFPNRFELTVGEAVLSSFAKVRIIGVVQSHDETAMIWCQNHPVWKNVPRSQIYHDFGCTNSSARNIQIAHCNGLEWRINIVERQAVTLPRYGFAIRTDLIIFQLFSKDTIRL